MYDLPQRGIRIIELYLFKTPAILFQHSFSCSPFLYIFSVLSASLSPSLALPASLSLHNFILLVSTISVDRYLISRELH